MTATHRREKILELIKEDGSAKVVDLARIFKVTEPTIRQDLEKLEKDGLVVKEHGGAYLKMLRPMSNPFHWYTRRTWTKKKSLP